MSSKLKTLRRRNLALSIVIVALVAVVALRADPTVSVSREALPRVFPDFAPSEARRVELVREESDGRPPAKLVLQLREGGRWVMDSHHRYPLQSGADRLLDAVAAARQAAVVTERSETFAEYAGHEGWTEVTIVDAGGRTMASFGMGKYQYPETFLRVGTGDAQRVIRAAHIVPNVAAVEVKSWIDTRIWPQLSAQNAIRIDVEQRRDGRTLTLVKRGESPPDVEMEAPAKAEGDDAATKVWWVAAPSAGPAKKLAVEDMAREFTGMLLEGVEQGSLTAEDEKRFGFDDPQLVATLWVKSGETVEKHVLEVGAKVEGKEHWYVRRKDAQFVFSVNGATSLSRMRQAPDDFLEKAEGDARGGAPVPPDVPVPPDDVPLPPDDQDPPPDDGG